MHVDIASRAEVAATGAPAETVAWLSGKVLLNLYCSRSFVEHSQLFVNYCTERTTKQQLYSHGRYVSVMQPSPKLGSCNACLATTDSIGVAHTPAPVQAGLHGGLSHYALVAARVAGHVAPSP
jgi:hypothetical protein